MDNNKSKRSLKRLNFKDKYRLGIYNDTTYEQVFHFRLKGREVLVVLVISIFLLVGLNTFFIAFTPIREFIPGYPDKETRRIMQNNVLKIDSLENEIAEWAHYWNNSIRVLSGNSTQIVQNPPDSNNIANKPFVDIRSKQDSIFRDLIEQEEKFDFRDDFSFKKSKSTLEMHFMAPLKGKITSRFNAGENHLGIDIVSSPNDVVVATLDGTVIVAEWTLETGNTILIQHSDNIISVYKHNAKLLKMQGSKVKTGDAIAIMGNSGELTYGPHLHFELWSNGVPIDPEQYIVF
ncbi:MAG: M23 family metallopeptidase [Prevotellaceae bacterium]|jgi:murein DD-endopeptidase MepM/ murein hydrolase activator NlpD|nr:M23 family metallopeptidase [Prevotellaceae bacterium]